MATTKPPLEESTPESGAGEIKKFYLQDYLYLKHMTETKRTFLLRVHKNQLLKLHTAQEWDELLSSNFN